MANVASRTNDFLQELGVNAHLADGSSSYGSSDVGAQMAYLGFSNIRSEAPGNRLSTYVALGQQGIKFDLVTWNTDLGNQMGLIDKVAPYVTLVEGPNEVNAVPVSYKGLGGAAAAQAFQADLYNAVHSDPNLAGVRVMPFSLSMGFDMSGYGNVGASADIGNVHAYSGQGLPPFDQINYWTNQVTTAPGKPYAITETGFTTIYEPRGGVTQDVQAKWLMDTFLGNHVNGVVKTYVYQLEDGYSSPSSDIENHYGLFTVDGAPKQAATDLHNLTSILADKGANASSFAPGSLDYSVSGLDPQYGFQTLFSKSNGSFDVALWSEPNFFNPSTSQKANVTPSSVTVKLNGTYNVDVFDPVVGTGAISHAQGVSSINVQLTTDPLIVEVTPTGGAAASAPVIATPIPAASTGPAAPSDAPSGGATAAAAAVTLGSGSSSIVVGMSEDAYQGDAQFTVSVDGAQVGGTQTATASHAAGKSQAFTLLGNWAAGAHTVAVSFLNDLYGGGGTADRNLYVDGVTAGGTTVPGAPLYGNGMQSFTATLTSSVTTIGSGAGSITLGISEDAYQGDAQFTVSVDGTQIGGTQTATASHAAGKSQVFNVLGAFGAGPHSVSVNFLNDAWGGTAATDRNLYVDSFTAGGVTKPVGLALMAHGSQSFTTPSVIGPATLGSNPTLAFVTAAKAVTIDGGTVAGKTLTGGTARDVFVLHAGTSNGDTITNFKPSLTAGDFLELKGYGTGATLTQVDSTTWTANSASGAIHDVIKLTNAAALVPANVLFA